MTADHAASQIRHATSAPERTGAVLNLIRGAKVHAAVDVSLLADLVAEPELKRDLARHALDESRHAYLLLERMTELGFPAFRVPAALDRIENLLARTRARNLRQLHAGHGTVNEAELMELMTAAAIAEEDSIRKLRAHHATLAGDRRTQNLIADILADEERHLAYLTRRLARFEMRFSQRAVAHTRQRLQDVLREVDAAYHAALRGYFERAAA
jgi:bacterioferritin (cytochrome b1)